MTHRRHDDFSVGAWEWVSLAAVCAGLVAYLLHRAQGLDDEVLAFMAGGAVAAVVAGLLVQWLLWKLADTDRWAGVAACACAGACIAAAVGVVYMQRQNERIMGEATAVVRGLNRQFAVNLGSPAFILGGQAHREVLAARERMAELQGRYAHTEAAPAIGAMTQVMDTMVKTDLEFIAAQARVLELISKANTNVPDRADRFVGWRRQLEKDRITIANYGKRLAALSDDCRVRTRGLPLDDEASAAMCSAYTQHLDKRLPLVAELVGIELDIVDGLDGIIAFLQYPGNAWMFDRRYPRDEREISAAKAFGEMLDTQRRRLDRLDGVMLRVSTLAMVIPDDTTS
ncbi:MAG TPA: hypothetical protein VGD42_17700 [Lysobacter sp.]